MQKSQLIIKSKLVQIAEDIDLVLNIQRKFSYLQTIPGMLTIQRPYLPIQHPCITKPNFQTMETNNLHDEKSSYSFSMIAMNAPRVTSGTSGAPPLWINNTGQKVKIEEGTFHIDGYGDQKGKARWS